MSVEHVPAVYEHAGRGGSHLVILLTIAFYSDRHGAWTTDQATLQQRARLGRRHVKQILDDLVAAGELAVASHHGRGKHSTYRLLISSENVSQTAAFLAKPEPETTFPVNKPEAPLTFPVEKPEPQALFPHPPCPPFPPNPQSPLNPPKN
jgi:hypothetical protein